MHENFIPTHSVLLSRLEMKLFVAKVFLVWSFLLVQIAHGNLQASFHDVTVFAVREINPVDILVGQCEKEEVLIKFEVLGENFEIHDENCLKFSDFSVIKIVKIGKNQTATAKFYIRPLEDGEYVLTLKVNCGLQKKETDKIINTIGKTKSREKILQLKYRRFDGFYFGNARKIDGIFQQVFTVTVASLKENTKRKNGHFEYAIKQFHNKCELSSRDRSIGVRDALIIMTFYNLEKNLQMTSDDENFSSLVEIVMRQQKANGKFGETATQSAEEDVVLTAFVLIAIFENEMFVQKYRKEIKLAEKFIESNINRTTDEYLLAISSYALSFNDPETSLKILEKLEKAKVDNSEQPKDIEILGYKVLAYLKCGNSEKAFEIMKQFHPKVMYRVDVFEASFEAFLIYRVIWETSLLMKVELKGDKGFTKSFLFDKNSFNLTITINVPGSEGISINAEGSGLVRVSNVQLFRATGVREVAANLKLCIAETSIFIKYILPGCIVAAFLIFLAAWYMRSYCFSHSQIYNVSFTHNSIDRNVKTAI